jgi:hypothetical protein
MQVITEMDSRSIFKPLGYAYLDFKRLHPNESLKSFESTETANYLILKETLSYSTEAFNSEEFISKFVNGVTKFIQGIIKFILKIVVSVITFFKRLIMNAMDDKYIDSRSEFYENHKATILENYKKFGSRCQVNAIPPKNGRAFSSDNKIVLSISQTVNLLEELDVAFKQRAELWDEENKRVNNTEANNIFQQLYDRMQRIKTHITDHILLADLGIRTYYDLQAISLYDPQVKDFLLETVKSIGDTSSVRDSLAHIFRIPKKIMNIYLFGKPEIKAQMMPISDFLKFTGPGEFDKLTHNDMKKIKANSVIIDGLAKKMEIISERLEKSGYKFMESLRNNTPVLLQTPPSQNEAQNNLYIIQQWITPLISIAGSFYSYFSTIIIEYSMSYCLHRKTLVEAAMILVNQGK